MHSPRECRVRPGRAPRPRARSRAGSDECPWRPRLTLRASTVRSLPWMRGGEFLILPAGISLAGTVTGTYYELINQNLVSFGFLRAPNGTFTTIDSPGSAALGAAVINRPGWSREATSIQMVQRSTASCSSRTLNTAKGGEGQSLRDRGAFPSHNGYQLGRAVRTRPRPAARGGRSTSDVPRTGRHRCGTDGLPETGARRSCRR